jgi:hypothetical protein
MLKVFVLFAVLGAAFYAYKKLSPKVKAEVVAVDAKVSADVAAAKADVAAVEKKL